MEVTERITTFQLKLNESINRKVLATAAMKGETKHEWIEKAIKEKLDTNSDELFHLLCRAYRFVEGGPDTKLEQDLKAYCDFYSRR